MWDVERVSKGDEVHTTTVNIPGGTPFHVEFRDGWGGHYPVQKTQAKPGKGSVGSWVKGIPDEVAEAWIGSQQPWKQGYVLTKRKAPPKRTSPKKKKAVK